MSIKEFKGIVRKILTCLCIFTQKFRFVDRNEVDLFALYSIQVSYNIFLQKRRIGSSCVSQQWRTSMAGGRISGIKGMSPGSSSIFFPFPDYRLASKASRFFFFALEIFLFHLFSLLRSLVPGYLQQDFIGYFELLACLWKPYHLWLDRVLYLPSLSMKNYHRSCIRCKWKFIPIWVPMTTDLSWQRNDAITYFTCSRISKHSPSFIFSWTTVANISAYFKWIVSYCCHVKLKLEGNTPE